MVKIAPAATDSPIEPTVRAIFSSSSEPFISRSSAMPITAAGYVAAIVIPAFRPRYALAEPRIAVITSPISRARRVNSFISMVSGTYGACFFFVGSSVTGVLMGGILLGPGMEANSRTWCDLTVTLVNLIKRNTKSHERRTLARGKAA